MDIKNIKAVYFIGAGGIGMSAIARYFIKKGYVVAGYDKTPTPLTQQLEKEGMLLHYEETPNRASWSIHQPYRATTKSWFSSNKTASKYKSALSCWVH